MPLIFYILGVTGDLSQAKLLPALFELYSKGELPDNFSIVGFGRRKWTDTDFRKFVYELLEKKGVQAEDTFMNRLRYVQGDFDTAEDYRKLRTDSSARRLFYLAIPPSLYKSVLGYLNNAGLTKEYSDGAWARILVEKPFGNSLKDAEELNALAKETLQEDQLFRIDHYLAKGMLREILPFRENTPSLASMWNKDFIEKVEIQLFENKTVGERGIFYDAVGALRDVGQNHVLEMLALVAMKIPFSRDPGDFQKGRSEVLKALIPIDAVLQSGQLFKAQYKGFVKEPGILPDSKTETYFKIKAFLDLPEWDGVPFVLESGKGLNLASVSIHIIFKDPSKNLTFFIQPKEGIEYNSSFSPIDSNLRRDAYEKVFLDALQGNQTLFASAEETEAAWSFIEPIIENWGALEMHSYPQGSDPSRIIGAENSL
jgi:glucose-6-phosphate 1-dehydrogenase